MAINAVITKLFFSGSDYLESQVLWGSISIQEGIRNILAHGVNALFGTGSMYTPFFGVLSLLTVLLLIWDAIKNRNNVMSWLYVLAGMGLQICPFLLSFYMGTVPVARSQLAYPFVLACNVIILFGYHWRYIWLKYLGTILIIIILVNQANITTRFIYTDEIRAQEDIRLATMINMKINDVASSEKPIALVGSYSSQLNAACCRGELVGLSIFSMDQTALPHYFYSSNRVCSLMRTLGFPFNSVNEEQMLKAREQAFTMPSWPAEGSVVDAGEYVIVKLSEDQWPEEVMPITSEKVESPNIDNILQYAVDSAVVEDGRLTIGGWLFQTGVYSGEVMPEVILQHRETGECIQISTARTSRPDLVAAFENGELYVYGGYTAIVSLDDLEAPLSEYSLILGLCNQQTGETHYSETEYSWPDNLH